MDGRICDHSGSPGHCATPCTPYNCPRNCLSSLSHCRNVAALSYIFKLLCLPVTSPLHSILTALDTASTLHIPATQSCTRHQQSHPYQLSRKGHPQSRDSLLRAFPAGLTPLWNSLPATCFKSQPSLKHLQSFKVAIHNHLQRIKVLKSCSLQLETAYVNDFYL